MCSRTLVNATLNMENHIDATRLARWRPVLENNQSLAELSIIISKNARR